MDEKQKQEIRMEIMRKQSRELVNIWHNRASGEWQPETLEIVREILMHRGVPGIEDKIVMAGIFRQAYVDPIPQGGRYRGKGIMTLTNKGVQITARRVRKYAMCAVMPLLVLATIIAVMSGILAILWIAKSNADKAFEAIFAGAASAVVVALIGYGVRGILSKRENYFWPYAALRRFAVNPGKQLIALDFNTDKACTPVVMRCYNWQAVAQFLQKHAPQCDASQNMSGAQPNSGN